jgi:hypothetical protein
MLRKLPILAAAVIVAAMSVAPASAGIRPRVHNVTADNSNYGDGLGAAPTARRHEIDVNEDLRSIAS